MTRTPRANRPPAQPEALQSDCRFQSANILRNQQLRQVIRRGLDYPEMLWKGSELLKACKRNQLLRIEIGHHFIGHIGLYLEIGRNEGPNLIHVPHRIRVLHPCLSAVRFQSNQNSSVVLQIRVNVAG